MAKLVRGTLKATIYAVEDLPPAVDNSVYIQVFIGDRKMASTSKFDRGDELLDPDWQEHFLLELAHEIDSFTFVLKEAVKGKDRVIGQLKFGVEDLLNHPDHPELWNPLSIEENPAPKKLSDISYQLVDKGGKLVEDVTLLMSLAFASVQSQKQSTDLLESYFPMRENCKVTLYQDAFTRQTDLHDHIVMSDGSTYQATNAYEDIYEAIVNAEHFIYILGWSLWSELVMVRDRPSVPLGDLLKQKANNFVTVLVMIWDEKASTEVTPGLMGTFDEETIEFFKGSHVEVLKAYRRKDLKGPLGKHDKVHSWFYSHHQKCVMVDAAHPDDPDKRKPIGFLGGLDLTNGRYDSPDHPLFSTLNSLHKDDFYQGCVKVGESVGPRQPWHDIHCKIEGEVVMDEIKNFEERWRKQAPSLEYLGNLSPIADDKLFSCVSLNTEDRSWNCQMFRSITSDSAIFESDLFPKLTQNGGSKTEHSIYQAYIHQIRRAEKFIYIENQYFLGSAYAWDCDNKPKADHIIPFEITEKIIEKIEANENFHVYIVIPMYPEGDPHSEAVQAMLHWQTLTMKMMYSRIATAIKTHGRDTKPIDYLSFYCLGKREKKEPPILNPDEQPSSTEAKLRQTRRFMIYVHSKMMIVDDSYIIVGSANINQRSMGGTRDTEIAVGCYQPQHMINSSSPYSLPKAKVYGFRMALFAEHLNSVDEIFQDPSSVDCVREVRIRATKNWEIYTATEVQDTQGYLMIYPVSVEDDGTVSSLPDCVNIPDIDAPILGTRSSFIPDRITT